MTFSSRDRGWLVGPELDQNHADTMLLLAEARTGQDHRRD